MLLRSIVQLVQVNHGDDGLYLQCWQSVVQDCVVNFSDCEQCRISVSRKEICWMIENNSNNMIGKNWMQNCNKLSKLNVLGMDLKLQI